MDDEDLTPSEEEALADLAQRIASGEAELHLEARIERLNGDGQVVESRPIGRPTAPRPHYANPRLDLPDALKVGRELGAGGFAAIDFETATGSRASACAVAVAPVEHGQVTNVERWLIRPPGNKYDGFNISIHGITPSMTEVSPSMANVWPEVAAAVGDRSLVAHYAAFDMSVLRNALTADGSTWPNLTYFCTCALAKHVWPGKVSYQALLSWM